MSKLNQIIAIASSKKKSSRIQIKIKGSKIWKNLQIMMNI